jgi:hypothetical protein
VLSRLSNRATALRTAEILQRVRREKPTPNHATGARTSDLKRDPPPPGRNLGTPLHTRPAAHAHARTNSGSNTSPQPHVLSRWSVVRLGGSARASASAPASPIWFPAGREHHSPPIRIPAPYVRTRPLRADPPPPGRNLGTSPHATRSAAHAKTNSGRNTSPSRTYRGDRAPSDSAAVRAPAPPRPHLRFGSLQAASTTTLRY